MLCNTGWKWANKCFFSWYRLTQVVLEKRQLNVVVAAVLCSARFGNSLHFVDGISVRAEPCDAAYFFPSSCLRCCSSRSSRWSARFTALSYCSRSWHSVSSFFAIACFTLTTYARSISAGVFHGYFWFPIKWSSHLQLLQVGPARQKASLWLCEASCSRPEPFLFLNQQRQSITHHAALA